MAKQLCIVIECSALEKSGSEVGVAGTESEVQALLDVLPEAVRDSIVQLVKDKQSTGHEAAVQEAHSTKK